MLLSRPRLEVSIATQILSLWDGSRLVKSWPCSTSKFGIGFEEGSMKTPLGHFRIAEKRGDGASLHTIFKAREPVGEWHAGEAESEDLILGRILWLEGGEERNANTLGRYVYIHGTNGEDKIGQRASHGCIRLRNQDVVELYDLAKVGMPVWVNE
ncbi:L,D-transpeptidase [Phragmitibacter flavus]|uniref:L,D-transpeptidase n=1 Tax=Phragmitibacter flavus TaxID=2576071 RepID=A0A5R8KA75_9BACT|nr:L,D-transpeptidase [Phragmitibacter flavus]TLD69208.1 L,D-transpeptidase [Phragmitibacter flavus]